MKNSLIQKINNCSICEKQLPYSPKPIVQFSKRSKILIIGQAPGKVTHEKGRPWDDKSGERLRSWLGVTEKEFYDPSLFALVPMGFCYPGSSKNGDLPPRPECAETWLKVIKDYLNDVKLQIFIGQYACNYHFDGYKNLTELVFNQTNLTSNQIALPHPSPRNNIWLKKNTWFETKILSHLKNKIQNQI